MTTIGEKIKAARTARNLTQAQFAALIGEKSGSVITNWECNVSNPTLDKVSKICQVLNITPDFLFDAKGEYPSMDEMSIIRKYRKLDSFGKNAVDSVLDIEYDKVISTVSKKLKARMLKVDFFNYAASAGLGNFLETEIPEDIWVKETPEAEMADFVIPIAGDSMEPEFHNGDKVFVEKCSSVAIGEIGIFIVNGESYIKKLGEGCLLSLNEAYKPIKLTDEDSVYCCGRVLGVVEQ